MTKTKTKEKSEVSSTFNELTQLTPVELQKELEKPEGSDLVVGYNLSPKEEKAVMDLARRIDLTDQQGLIGYGSSVTEKLDKYSAEALKSYNTQQLGEAGSQLATLVTSLKSYNPNFEDKLSSNKIVRFFQTKKRDAELALTQAKASYATINANVDESKKILEQKHLASLLSNTGRYDELLKLNEEYYKEFSLYIAAGKERLRVAKTEELPKLNDEAVESNNALLAQKAKDFADAINEFEAQLYDLELSRQQCLYNAASIRQMQKITSQLAKQIRQIILTAIPQWRMQMELHLGIKDAQDAKAAIDFAHEFTQNIILSGVEQVRDLTVSTAENAGRPTIDLETAQKVNDIFIETIQKELEINKRTMIEVREGEKALKQMEEKRNKAMMTFSQETAKISIGNALSAGIEEEATPIDEYTYSSSSSPKSYELKL